MVPNDSLFLAAPMGKLCSGIALRTGLRIETLLTTPPPISSPDRNHDLRLPHPL